MVDTLNFSKVGKLLMRITTSLPESPLLLLFDLRRHRASKLSQDAGSSDAALTLTPVETLSRGGIR